MPSGSSSRDCQHWSECKCNDMNLMKTNDQNVLIHLFPNFFYLSAVDSGYNNPQYTMEICLLGNFPTKKFHNYRVQKKEALLAWSLIGLLYKTDLVKSIFRTCRSTPWCVLRTFLDPATARTLSDECFCTCSHVVYNFDSARLPNSVPNDALCLHSSLHVLEIEQWVWRVHNRHHSRQRGWSGKIEKVRAAETVSASVPAAVMSCKC